MKNRPPGAPLVHRSGWGNRMSHDVGLNAAVISKKDQVIKIE